MKNAILAVSLLGLAGTSFADTPFQLPSLGAADISEESADSRLPEPFYLPPADAKGGDKKPGLDAVSKTDRRDYIRRASLWEPEEKLPGMSFNFSQGPYSPMKYRPEETVSCAYVPMAEAYEAGKPNGMTPKFKCRDARGKDLKVKYGEENGEVITEVAASWILHAIGAYADRMYPVRLHCPDCPSDPFKSERDPGAWTSGSPVAIEDKIGKRIEYKPNSGIGFDEFHLIEDRVGAEALTGLAHFLANTDNKAPNQAIGCRKDDIEKGPGGEERCLRPFVYMQDLGVTFGGRKFYHNSRMHYDAWAKEKIWDDPAACVLHLKAVRTSSLTGVDESGRDLHQIGERARQFLVGRLSRLSREQLTAIFAAARAPEREPRHSAEEWADLFLARVDKLRRPLGDRTPADFSCPYETVPPGSAPRPQQYY